MMEQVFAQAKVLAGIEEGQQTELLRIYCQAAVTALTGRLREGVTVADCETDFINAASLLALAAYTQTDPLTNLQQIQIGDMTMRPGGGCVAAKELRNQAELIMIPYCRDGFSFLGV